MDAIFNVILRRKEKSLKSIAILNHLEAGGVLRIRVVMIAVVTTT